MPASTLAPALSASRRQPGQFAADAAMPEPPHKGVSQAPLTAAALLDDPRHLEQLDALRSLGLAIGAPLDCTVIPGTLARGGTVGRIGVPAEATATMLQQRVVIGATVGADPLLPVARLWRGMQRRADVHVDVRQCTTLAGSAAERAGNQRDVLLFSQRVVEGSPRRRGSFGASTDAVAMEWSRARDAADLAYRLAAAEQRRLLLVLPVGRGTEAQQYFGDALERQARLHRMPVPRVVKAGLLAALLSGDGGSERWLVASVIPIDELCAMVRESVGDTGPWPVISIGRDVTFLDMPSVPAAEPLPLLLAMSTLLQRSGRSDLARTLVQATLLTTTAVSRMREELGGALTVPVDAFMQGVLANWGRVVPASAPRDRRALTREPGPVVAGLRLRVETTLTATAVRDTVASALMPAGLEVASVRSADATDGRGEAFTYDVRVRSRLGEPPLSDIGADAVRTVLRNAMRCVAVEPWIPVAATERGRARATG